MAHNMKGLSQIVKLESSSTKSSILQKQLLQLYLSYMWCIHNLVCVMMIQKFHFFSFLIWMRTFQTDNRTFKIRITTVDQCSLDCCSGVLISTLSKYLSEKLYHYTNHNFFFRIRLVAISLFVTYCIHVSSSGSCKSSFFISNAS